MKLTRRQPLTPRELQVLKAVAEGNSSKETARKLGGITPRTVAFHIGRIKEKCGLRGRADMIRYAFAEGIVSVEIERAVNRHRIAGLDEPAFEGLFEGVKDYLFQVADAIDRLKASRGVQP